jgi:hypothetical protein
MAQIFHDFRDIIDGCAQQVHESGSNLDRSCQWDLSATTRENASPYGRSEKNILNHGHGSNQYFRLTWDVELERRG